ncbi:MAG: anthranilate phosphoribosyltransferase, partial [Flavobacteriales bacterium]|nr:anthranilate phosphoribosyltransferase [Flavobacteriales bacterium]
QTVAESADIFDQLLRGNGTEEQENVVAANAAVAYQTVYPESDLKASIAIAKENIKNGAAKTAFEKLIKIKS